MLPPLLPALTDLARPPFHRERRSARRQAPAGPTPCLLQAAGEEEWGAAWLHNLSTRGVGVISARFLPAGAALAVMLINPGHTYAMSVQATVVRSFRVANGDFFLGCRLVEALTYGQITPLLL
jgi:hypothetical protein